MYSTQKGKLTHYGLVMPYDNLDLTAPSHCIDSISHNAQIPYPTMLHSEQNVLNGALWDMEQVHSGICDLGQL